MSDEFLEFQFPCKECLVTAICREKPGITGSDKQNLLERDRTHCLTLPYVSKDKHYHKMLIECWANLGQSMFCQVQNVENPVGTNVELQVPINYIFMLRTMADIAQYIVNSTSWGLQQLQDFDRDEINRKVKMLKL